LFIWTYAVDKIDNRGKIQRNEKAWVTAVVPTRLGTRFPRRDGGTIVIRGSEGDASADVSPAIILPGGYSGRGENGEDESDKGSGEFHCSDISLRIRARGLKLLKFEAS
jgi:hypothetical protein